jgi:hypothetical protein
VQLRLENNDMHEQDLANDLANRRQKMGFPENLSTKAYEIISDHTSHGVPRWHGLYYNIGQQPAVLPPQRKLTLEKDIERLRDDNKATTHHALAAKSTVADPFLYKVLRSEGKFSAEVWDWKRYDWVSVDTLVRGILDKLHQQVLWPGFFSRERKPCLSLVLGYKSKDRVIGVWAFHAILNDSVNSLFSPASVSRFIYPVVCSLNAIVADRLQENEEPRWDLATLAQEAFVGRGVTQNALRKTFLEHSQSVSKIAIKIIENDPPFVKLLADRTDNYGTLFDELLMTVMERVIDGKSRSSSWRGMMVRGCFIGWHARIRLRATTDPTNTSVLILEKEIARAQSHAGIPIDQEYMKTLKDKDGLGFLKYVVSIIFLNSPLESVEQADKMAFLILAKTLEMSECESGLGSIDEADNVIRAILEKR